MKLNCGMRDLPRKTLPLTGVISWANYQMPVSYSAATSIKQGGNNTPQNNCKD